MNSFNFGICDLVCCTPVLNSVSEAQIGSDNVITINFTACEPADSFTAFYRPLGDVGAYRDGGTLTSSPFIITDSADELGTNYEGYILSNCAAGTGPQVPFTTGARINWNYANFQGIGGRFRIVVNGITMVNITADAVGYVYINVDDDVTIIVQSGLDDLAKITITGPYNHNTSVTHINADSFIAETGTYHISGASF